MSASEGLRIISVTKSLEGYKRGDQYISRFFGATTLAGYAGLFLSSLRQHRKMKWRKFSALAASAHIATPMLSMAIVPWLKKGGFIEVGAMDDGADVLLCPCLKR